MSTDTVNQTGHQSDPEASHQRMNLRRNNPEVYSALTALAAASAQGLDQEIGEIVKIRASQINGCAYCLNMHVTDAMKLGMDPMKLHLIGVWREARAEFTDRELAVLAFTEEVTHLGPEGVSDDVFDSAAAYFDTEEMGALLSSVVMINAWNRIAVTSRYPVRARRRAAARA